MILELWLFVLDKTPEFYEPNSYNSGVLIVNFITENLSEILDSILLQQVNKSDVYQFFIFIKIAFAMAHDKMAQKWKSVNRKYYWLCRKRHKYLFGNCYDVWCYGKPTG